jgi:hypothetical protein
VITTQCSVCRLEPEYLNAINIALRNESISFDELARASGIHRSILDRHVAHLKGRGAPIAIEKSDAAREIGLTKQEILCSIESLWQEAQEGLEASKAPITLKKSDGSTIELKAGDLRARAAFIREGRQVLEAAADWSGFPRTVSNQPGAMIQIVIPSPCSPSADLDGDDGAIEIRLPKR